MPSVERCASWSVRMGENANNAPAARAAASPEPSPRAQAYAVRPETAKVSSRARLNSTTASVVASAAGATRMVVPSTGSSIPSV